MSREGWKFGNNITWRFESVLSMTIWKQDVNAANKVREPAIINRGLSSILIHHKGFSRWQVVSQIRKYGNISLVVLVCRNSVKYCCWDFCGRNSEVALLHYRAAEETEPLMLCGIISEVAVSSSILWAFSTWFRAASRACLRLLVSFTRVPEHTEILDEQESPFSHLQCVVLVIISPVVTKWLSINYLTFANSRIQRSCWIIPIDKRFVWGYWMIAMWATSMICIFVKRFFAKLILL